MTERENVLHALSHDRKTQWVPVVSKSIQFLKASCHQDKIQSGLDWFGVEWRDEIPVKPLFDDICSWREYVHFPNLDAMDWEKERLQLAWRDSAKASWVMCSQGFFERLHTFVGFENALVAMYEEPDAVHELVEAMTDFRLHLIDKIVETLDPDIIDYRDDYGTQLNTFFSRDMFREFFAPAIQRVARHVKSKGKVFVLHSCGKVDSLVGDFIDLGADAWDSVQSCCDLDSIYEKYGKSLSFSCSSMEMQKFSACTEDEIRQIVRHTIDRLGRFGNVLIWDEFPIDIKMKTSIITSEVAAYGKDYYSRYPIPQG